MAIHAVRVASCTCRIRAVTRNWRRGVVDIRPGRDWLDATDRIDGQQIQISQEAVLVANSTWSLNPLKAPVSRIRNREATQSFDESTGVLAGSCEHSGRFAQRWQVSQKDGAGASNTVTQSDPDKENASKSTTQLASCREQPRRDNETAMVDPTEKSDVVDLNDVTQEEPDQKQIGRSKRQRSGRRTCEDGINPAGPSE